MTRQLQWIQQWGGKAILCSRGACSRLSGRGVERNKYALCQVTGNCGENKSRTGKGKYNRELDAPPSVRRWHCTESWSLRTAHPAFQEQLPVRGPAGRGLVHQRTLKARWLQWPIPREKDWRGGFGGHGGLQAVMRTLALTPGGRGLLWGFERSSGMVQLTF